MMTSDGDEGQKSCCIVEGRKVGLALALFLPHVVCEAGIREGTKGIILRGKSRSVTAIPSQNIKKSVYRKQWKKFVTIGWEEPTRMVRPRNHYGEDER